MSLLVNFSSVMIGIFTYGAFGPASCFKSRVAALLLNMGCPTSILPRPCRRPPYPSLAPRRRTAIAVIHFTVDLGWIPCYIVTESTSHQQRGGAVSKKSLTSSGLEYKVSTRIHMHTSIAYISCMYGTAQYDANCPETAGFCSAIQQAFVSGFNMPS